MLRDGAVGAYTGIADMEECVQAAAQLPSHYITSAAGASAKSRVGLEAASPQLK